MVIAPSQMVGYHKLNEILPSLLITCNNENVEQVKSWRLHGVEFDQNRTWNNFIISKLKHCYLILSCPRKCKRYTPYHIKKQLAESLISSRLGCGNILLQNTSLVNKKGIQ